MRGKGSLRIKRRDTTDLDINITVYIQQEIGAERVT